MSSFDTIKDPYQLLVLEGPSEVGKTAFARSLVPRAKQCAM